jgi:hypothetical protein
LQRKGLAVTAPFLKPPFPGSPEAITRGCTCDPEINRRGYGKPVPEGIAFIADALCPLHGYEELRALDDGEANTMH